MASTIETNSQFPPSSLIARYDNRSGHIKTEGSLTFPLQENDDVVKKPVLHFEYDEDFKSRLVATLDLGPTNETKEFSDFPTYFRSIPVYMDPGWLTAIKLGLPGGLAYQSQIGGQLLLTSLVIRCDVGAVGVYYGALDPYDETGLPIGNDPSPTRPFILQAGGVFAQSFKGGRPFSILIDYSDLSIPEMDRNRVVVQGLPSLAFQTYEDLNRVRVVATVDVPAP